MFNYKLFSQSIKNSKMTSASLSEVLTKEGIKISKDTIDSYRKGAIKNPPIDKLTLISEKIGKSVEYFLGSDEVPLKTIPLIGIASCGVPLVSYNDIVEYIPVPEKFAVDGVYAVTADGDSMETKIKHGDIVYCNKELECRNGDIVHYTTIDGHSGLKKFVYNEETTLVTLYPLNTEGHNPIVIPKEDLRCARTVGSFSQW